MSGRRHWKATPTPILVNPLWGHGDEIVKLVTGTPRGVVRTLFLACGVVAFLFIGGALANPYLHKSGEAPLVARVGTCSITGGFIHLYSALFNGLFDKYGIKIEHV